jgi:hypothetical protein
MPVRHTFRRLALIVCLFATTLKAEPLVLNSGTSQVTLLELYTSQGCSSCPPAERWLNEFTDSDRLWTHIVPVAMHVDYWDYLGWQDPYASPANTERQRSYAQHNRARAVYTPGMFVNGREWRGWTYRLSPRASGREPGVLSASIENGQLHTSFPVDDSELELHVAVLGFDIATPVKRGENRNKTLQQEFVSLAYTIHRSMDGQWSVPVPEATQPAGRYGIALWVSTAGNPVPLQATGGWLPGPALQSAR